MIVMLKGKPKEIGRGFVIFVLISSCLLLLFFIPKLFVAFEEM